jgi:hypothetical protein
MEDDMSKGIVISLYDFTGEALKPWALAGYTCYAFDIQHSKQNLNTDTFVGSKGSINYIHADLHSFDGFIDVMRAVNNKPVVFGMAFPVCTDMAVSGAAHFKRKAERDPDFQTKAVRYAKHCADFFTSYDIPYFIENPVSVLATMWRKPDYYFHPYYYGGYIPDDEAEHPRWPEYIAPYDAYPKKTCLWTGGNFNMPPPCYANLPDGSYSKQHLKLGGKSQRTKDIRSATPRGFAIAIYEANSQPVEEYA